MKIRKIELDLGHLLGLIVYMIQHSESSVDRTVVYALCYTWIEELSDDDIENFAKERYAKKTNKEDAGVIYSGIKRDLTQFRNTYYSADMAP